MASRFEVEHFDLVDDFDAVILSRLLEDAARAAEQYHRLQTVADAAFERYLEQKKKVERYRLRRGALRIAEPVNMKMDLS